MNPPARIPASGSRILIVDDEPDMCWALEHLLRQQGYATRTALSGRQALALMQSGQFFLVFLDAKLPDVDGLELARQIRQQVPHLRIIMVSGYFYRDDVVIQEALASGLIRAFISKPFCREEILQAVAL